MTDFTSSMVYSHVQVKKFAHLCPQKSGGQLKFALKCCHHSLCQLMRKSTQHWRKLWALTTHGIKICCIQAYVSLNELWMAVGRGCISKCKSSAVLCVVCETWYVNGVAGNEERRYNVLIATKFGGGVGVILPRRHCSVTCLSHPKLYSAQMPDLHQCATLHRIACMEGV